MRAKGFTLIESVVALAILALTVTVVYQIFGWTLRHAADQRHRDWAWLTAQSLLEQVRADGSLTAERRIGRTPQGLTWETVVKPAQVAPSAVLQVTVFEVTVKVNWRERPNRHIELRSIELGAAQ